MDVKSLCLGILSQGDATGYEIKKQFENGYNHFYEASFGLIYPALARLTEDGFVSCTQRAQENDRIKKYIRLPRRAASLSWTS
jgi:PadR family transcriptional regulator AphA